MEILKKKKHKKWVIMIFATVIFTALLTIPGTFRCYAYESGEELDALLSEIPDDVLEYFPEDS